MIELGIVLVVGVGIVGFSAWTHTIDRRKELESTAVQREKIHTLAESVRFLRDRSDSLESENKDLRKQLGMSPMRRPAFQAESAIESALTEFRNWLAIVRAEAEAKEDHV